MSLRTHSCGMTSLGPAVEGCFGKVCPRKVRVSHHVGFGLQVGEVLLTNACHGLVVLQVLPHLLVSRIGHEEGVCC